MIIKSMSRKEASFDQLYDYITKDKDLDFHYRFTHNFIRQNRDGILREFHRNAQLLQQHKGANYLYHEIISITRSQQISEEKQKEILHELISQYVQSRARDCLVYGGLHDDKETNLHFHLMISSNRLNESSRYRLSKHQFDEIKRGLETYVLQKYPELEQAQLITKERARGKSNNREQELKRRTQQPSKKDRVKEKLRDIFHSASSKQEFFALLDEQGLSIYLRGQQVGVQENQSGRKHRLSTLGIDREFQEFSQKIELEQVPQAQRKAKQKTDEQRQKAQQPKDKKPEEKHNQKEGSSHKQGGPSRRR
ncbi:MAG: hypothetical protein K6L74_15120 [Neptuniibacter sp.]